MVNINLAGSNVEDSYESFEYEMIVGGVAVGYASLMVDESSAYVERIDIDEVFRGHGYGTRFISHLSRIYGGVILAPDNADSQRLFERIGYDVSEKFWAVDQGYGVYEVA